MEEKNIKGITLIALVITIIVLLILAGVSIATLTGENGLLSKAQEAKKANDQAEEDELRKLTAIEAATYLEEHEYEDPSGEKITIPAQCAVSQVEGENTLEDGLVIIDKNGNEWVWIEVPKSVMQEGLLFENDEDYTILETDLQEYASEYRETEYTDVWYEGSILEQNVYLKLKQNMLKSVYLNRGFWIGRYEVGDSVATKNNITRNSKSGIENLPVIQENQIPYNYITCNQAQQLTKKLSLGTDKNISLMFGIQWDLVCKFLEEKSDLNIQDINTKSITWGNFRDSSVFVSRGKYNISAGIETNEWTDFLECTTNHIIDNRTNSDINYFQALTTGASETTKKMNIYDFAGNMWEWTLEYYNNIYNPCTLRGGGYWSSQYTDEAAATRTRLGLESIADSWGFRATLY